MTISDIRYTGPLADRIGEWASRLIDPYLAQHPLAPTSRKQIHDPLGRIIDLAPWEVYVVDSPIFQRLRYIRQLGVGHFLFPTAGYSRFEHSLGAMQTATMMFESVVAALRDSENSKGPPYGDEVFQKQKSTVRLAALVHDIGHCIFSHVSERVYARNDDLKKAQKHFKERLPPGNVSASETVSLLILQSEAFLRLLKAARVQKVVREDDLVLEMMMCVAGSVSRIAPNSYMAEIINGPVDCDKLDYLSRDAHMAGVPIPLDTTRLLSKLRIAVKTKKGEEDKFALAIVPSGMRALDELQVARIFLFDKFYYHQKVMAAEELIRRALTFLNQSVPGLSDPSTLIEFGDDEFLALSPKAIESRFGCPPDKNIELGCDLLRRVRNRDLPKRVFAMANRFIPDPPDLLALFYARGGPIKAKEGNVDFYQMSRSFTSVDLIEIFKNRIAGLAEELGTETEVYFAHQVPARAASSMYLPVLRDDGHLDERPKYLFASDFWTEAYASNKATSYVFADKPTADVFLATERLVKDQWNLSFDRSCWVTAKMSEDLIDTRRSALPAGWAGHRLPPDFLDARETRLRIEAVVSKFASFLSAFHAKWGPQLVESWVAQFPDGDMRDSALRLLEHMTFVGPETLDSAFRNFAKGDKLLESGIWVPFRQKKGPGESADQLSVDLKDVVSRQQHISTLTAEEIRAAGSVVLYDDTLNSGIQSECRLLAWFGADQSSCEHEEDWDIGGPLPTDVQEALRSVPLVIAVYAKHPTGDSRIRKTAKLLNLHLMDVRGVIDSGSPDYTLDGFKAATDESRTRFVDFLSRIGESILRSTKADNPKWSPERIAESALGYSGIPLTIVFRHSISTSTPVALWGMDSDFEDPWMPVFPRDRKGLRALLQGGVDHPPDEVPDYEGP